MSDCIGKWWKDHKWKDLTQGKLAKDKMVIGENIIQERRCEICNKVELRTASTTIYE